MRGIVISACIAAFAIGGCRSTPHPGGTCHVSTECGAPLVCDFAVCRQTCTTSRDCASGERCLVTGATARTVCSVPTDTCDTSMCPGALTCLDGSCVSRCIGDGDCPDGHCASGACLPPGSADVDASTGADAP